MRKDKGAPQCCRRKICCANNNCHHHHHSLEQMLYRYNISQTAAYQQVNRVEENRDQPPAPLGRNVYEDPHLCMVVFVTEPTDRQSVHRRSMEVNAVMPAVPKYMLWSDQEITWSFKDHPKIMPNPGGYALVVDPIMKGPETRVKFSKVLIDNGSSINIMYKHTMRTLGITENMLQPTHTTFHGIVPGLSCAPIGKVRVDVSFGGRDNCRVENIEFEVVDLDSPYHALLGRPALAAFMDSTHTAYLKMKMPAPRGPLTVVGNYKVSMETASGSNLAESLVIAEEKKRMQTALRWLILKVELSGNEWKLGLAGIQADKRDKEHCAGSGLPRAHRVPRELAEHSLNVRKDAKPVRQPLRRFAEDRRKIIGEEVTKLLVAGFIVEVTHTEWLANPVMVEKKKDENLEAQAPKVWRMCIDYTNLNKACPRDPFPLPQIDQADAAFKELKNMLVTAPILASPLEREPMLLYIAATNRVVSVVVVVEREEEGKTVQRPVYYLSEVLSFSKQNYPHFQKMTYGVFMAATKLKHYFEEHPMKVVSEAPISDIMGNKDASGRIAKWAIQLSPYVPVYERRDAIKSQALADFLVDWAEIQYKPPEHKIEYWKMHFDGSKLKEGLGAGVVLTSPKGDHLRYVLQVHFRASNNVAEYEALIHGLRVAKEIGALRIICYGDSDLVVQQCSGDWDAKDANMASYRFHVQKIAGFFEGCEFHHVPRAENEAADALSKLGSSRQEIPPGIALAHLRIPSIKPSPESESIFVPESHVVPMEIDEGNPGAVPANPGTVPVNSGTATPRPEEAMLVDSMDIDMPVFVVREAPSWLNLLRNSWSTAPCRLTKMSPEGYRGGPKLTLSLTVRHIKEVLPVSSKDVWSRKKEEKCLRRFIEENAGTTPRQGHWWQKCSGMDSIGQRLMKMRKIWSGSRGFRGSSAGIRSWRWHVLAFIFLLLAQIIFDIFRRGMKFLEKEKLKSNGSNFTDWFRHVRIFLNGGNLQYVLDAPLGDPPAETETDEVKNVYATRKTRYSQVQCAILCSLESDLQKRFEHHDPHELMKELKTIFETHAAVECYEASKHFFSCMMEEGSSISEHMLVMTGHAKKLSDLGIVIPNRLGINRVLQSLPPSYKNFVMNYNMQNMNKEFPELFGMLKAAEIEIKKEHQVLMVNKTTSFKKQGKSKGKFKKGGKKAATPPMKPKNGPKPDADITAKRRDTEA
ncbi:hypothetical protein QYE76_002126 [Lolium multiflorum]|uniref:RNase H type-1 domain-containing protein n=1 Tax=Lolium multiflorum TaxID=4521 RepID=A0AAD8W0B8_LOLMU|nr:hypothetical protein QYE76_002126 [Lolium multiflorum]